MNWGAIFMRSVFRPLISMSGGFIVIDSIVIVEIGAQYLEVQYAVVRDTQTKGIPCTYLCPVAKVKRTTRTYLGHRLQPSNQAWSN